MTPAERLEALERAEAISQTRMDRVEMLLLRVAQNNDKTSEQLHSLALTVTDRFAKVEALVMELGQDVQQLTRKIDQFVDAVFNRPNGKGQQ